VIPSFVFYYFVLLRNVTPGSFRDRHWINGCDFNISLFAFGVCGTRSRRWLHRNLVVGHDTGADFGRILCGDCSTEIETFYESNIPMQICQTLNYRLEEVKLCLKYMRIICKLYILDYNILYLGTSTYYTRVESEKSYKTKKNDE
jgi:hypothetical protein